MMQIMPNQAMGYDRAITVFSPDGRILQVEYATEAVARGAMTLGIVHRDGVLLVADRRITEKLIVPASVRKTAQIDDHIGSSFAGLTSDARVLVRKCRTFAQQNKLTYGEPIDVEGIVKFVTDTKQAYTQYGGIRPFGISFLIGGVDKKGSHLFVTEPSGIYAEYQAKAIGMGAIEADSLLEKKYRPNLKQADALKLAVEIFKTVLKKEFSVDRLEAMSIAAEKTEIISAQ